MIFERFRLQVIIISIVTIIIIGLTFLFDAGVAYASVETAPAKVNKSVINIRSGPSLLAPIIGAAYKNDVLNFVFAIEDSDWSEILYGNAAAYVYTDYLSFVTFKEKPLYTPDQFKFLGVIEWNGWRWTWYSQNVLPGNGLNIPGRHVDENNYICDENDYICLATYELPQGTVVDTPFGKQGKVYDTGCPSGTLDVYTNF